VVILSFALLLVQWCHYAIAVCVVIELACLNIGLVTCTSRQPENRLASLGLILSLILFVAEVEFELTQTYVTQKPFLWVEVG
jgi:hypothetical protein